MTRARRLAAGLIFVALVASGVRGSILRLLFPPHRPPDVAGPVDGVDRRPLRFRNDPTPLELQRFLEDVRGSTLRGERIAFAAGPGHDGFSYTYWRASYVWSGRTVLLPVSLVAPENADVIAIWNAQYDDPRYEVLWREGNGALARRKP